MKELIAKLEAAQEGSRELDGLIFRATRPNEAARDWEDFDGVWYLRDKDDAIAWEAPPAYTTSLDATLTLVPPTYKTDVHTADASVEEFPTRYEIIWGNSGGAGANVYGDPTWNVEPPLLGGGCAHTPALALCIAALKARAAQ